MGILVVDVETTGLNSKEDRVIEFGAVALDKDGNEVGRISQLVDPGVSISPFITQITGITNAMIRKDGIPFEKCAKRIFNWINSCTWICGQNVDFDKRFLSNELSLCDLHLPEKPTLDTLELSRRFIPLDVLRSKNLKSLSNYFGVDLTNAHRAVHDCDATGKVLFALLKEFDLTIDEAVSNEIVSIGKHSIGKDPFQAMLEGMPVKHH